ncbi:MAG: glycerophosphodiester phosphodiesterase [Isosphaeraceae bacterium]
MRLLRLFALAAVVSTGAGADGPIVIAHRGASGYLPEHTQEAVVLAHAQGADYIEQDLVLSKDGVPVVLHDVQIDTVTDVADRFPGRKRADGRWYAIDFTLDELKALNVTERKDHRTGKPALPGRFPVGVGSFRIPTFEEEIDLIEGLNRTTGRHAGIYPEIKAPAWHRGQGADPSRVVLEILKKRGYFGKEARCYVQCFEWAEVKRIREELGYSGRLIFLFGGRPFNGDPDPTLAAGLDKIAAVVDGLGPALPFVLRPSAEGKPGGADLMRLAHERKLEVHPWTVRSDALPANFEGVDGVYQALFHELRVDGLFTDHPAQAVGFLKGR